MPVAAYGAWKRRQGGAASWTLVDTWPTITSWTASGVVVDDGQADPFGGTDGAEITDDNSSAFESIEYVGATALVSGQTYRLTYYVKKDLIGAATRAVEFQNESGTNFVRWDIDTSTGTVGARSVSGWTVVSLTSSETPAGWWKVVLVFTANAAGTIDIKFFPAVGTGVPATISNSRTGSATFYPRITLEQAT